MTKISADSVSPGTVVWITGLPGSGKTTIAREVFLIIRSRTPAVAQLDGDLFREVMGHDLGYSMEDRLRNAWRLAHMCRLLSEQGFHVVCATVSLFRELHEWNRVNLSRYVEVYLRVTHETLASRNQKGLVRKAITGEVGNLIGVNQSFDEPTEPHLIIDNDDGGDPPENSALRIAALVTD